MFLNHYQTIVRPLCLSAKRLLYSATESISINPEMNYTWPNRTDSATQKQRNKNNECHTGLANGTPSYHSA